MRNKWVKYLLIFFLFSFGLFTYGFWIEPNWLEISKHTIPASVSRKIRIVQLSDLHLGRGRSLIHSSILKALGELKPDLILITGDSVSPNTNYQELAAFLSKLNCPLGKFAIEGNWEKWLGQDGYGISLKESGVTDLSNDFHLLKENLEIVGIENERKSRNILPKRKGSKAYRIGLIHEPEKYDSIAANFDLVLAGHTHGGQVNLPFVGALWLPPGSGNYLQGWYSSGASKLYVSRGIGMSILPFRFLARPELSVFDLHPILDGTGD